MYIANQRMILSDLFWRFPLVNKALRTHIQLFLVAPSNA